MGEKANNTSAATASALDAVLQNFNALPGAQRWDFLNALVVVSVNVMRSMRGEEFVREYLTAAITSLDDPPMLQPMPTH